MNPTNFDPSIEQLQAMVAITSQITASDLSDDTQLAVVKDNRIKLRDARITIEKAGKAKREEALKFQKDVIAYEKELLAILSPEENRLKAIEDEAKQIKERAARAALLPMRKEQLSSIGITDLTDEALLDMDNDQFVNYLNVAKAAYLDKQIAAANAEKNRLAREAELAQVAEAARVAERNRAEAQAKAEEERRIQTEAQHKYDTERAAQKLIDDAKAEADRVLAVAKAQEEAKLREEQERVQQEKDAEEKRIKNERYQQWLSDIGYKEEDAVLWQFKQDGNITGAFKFVSSFAN